MIRSIVTFCIEERLIVVLVAFLVIAFGWFSPAHTPAFNPMGQPEQARHHV